jgi:O-antigen/teichoic acid export membrane protein
MTEASAKVLTDSGNAVVQDCAQEDSRRPVVTPSLATNLLIDIRAVFQRLFPLATKGGLAILDQALFAGTNFIVNILLARWLTPAEYGAFALAYSVFLLFGTFHTASLTEPMMVFGSGKYAGHFEKYLGILVRGHFTLMLPSGLILVVAAFLLGRVYSTSVERAFLGLALAAPFILLLWLVRRAFYVRLQPAWAAAGGFFYLVFLLGFMSALWAGQRLSPVTAFLGMGVGALAVSVFLLFRFQPRRVAVGGVISLVLLLALIYLLWLGSRSLPVITFLGMGAAALVVSIFLLLHLGPTWTAEPGNPSAAMVLADHWRYGRWSVATAGISWLPSNVYYVLLPNWFGLEGAGAFRALMNLAMPVLHSIGALSGILLPVLVRNRKHAGTKGMTKTMKSFLALFVAGSALYLILLWGLRSQLFQLLYGGKYQEYTFLPVLLVGLLPFGASATAVLGSGLRALERPDWLFWCYVGSAVIAFVAGIPLAATIGVSGALLGMVLSSLAAGLLMLVFCKKSMSQQGPS